MSEYGAERFLNVIHFESERLDATDCGISTPERVMGALWPGEVLQERRRRPRTLLSLYRWVYYHVGLWLPMRLADRLDLSGWRPRPQPPGPVRRFLTAWVRRWE